MAGGISLAAAIYLVFSLQVLGLPLRRLTTRMLLTALVPAVIADALAAVFFTRVPGSVPRWLALALLGVFGLCHVALSSQAACQVLEQTPLKSPLTSDRRVDCVLEEGDIVGLPKSTMAEVGYVLRQLAPGLGSLSFGFAFRD